MAGYRHRYMLNVTGHPGWMRFGFSPGWQGVSPTGLPPAAEYLKQTGQMPQFTSFVQQQAPFAQQPEMLKEQEIAMLTTQANALEEQLKNIRKRLEELK